jgi:UDP-N-acetylmuramoyl-L-alanyl-D-glutamate--2,6-diaminopimelate ligase
MAFVDYAHTDDALRSVLSVLRPLAAGKLITVFGCGGDRDRGKRPLMARAAEELSDQVVVTSDNPRTENPSAIIDEIMAGFVHPEAVAVEADRERAVALAVGFAGPDDAILVAGKGHEDYQIVGTVKRRLDDRKLLRNAFRV